MNRRALPIAALAVALAAPTFAQGPGGPEGPGRPGRPGFGGPGGPEGPGRPAGPRGPLGLLMIPEVQRELKLQPSQIEKLSALLPEGRRPEGRGPEGRPGAGRPGGERPGAGRPGGGERPQGAGRPEGPRGQGGAGRGERGGPGQDGEREKQLAGILDEKQLARFKQLELQQAGARAAGRPDVAATLNLSEAQREKVHAAIEAEHRAMRELFETARDENGPRDLRQKAEAARKGTETQINAVLTDTQKKQLREMQGAPFAFPAPRPGGPGGPEGRSGRGGGRPGQ